MALCRRMSLFLKLHAVLVSAARGAPTARRELAFMRGGVLPRQHLVSCLSPQMRLVCSAVRKKSDDEAVFTNVTQTAPLGPRQPPLTITYTNQGASVSEWLARHASGDQNDFLGFDTESVPSVRSSSLQYKGPATLQLATADGACLIVHLAHVSRQNCFVDPASGAIKDAPEGAGLANRFRGLEDLVEMLRDQTVLKCGVGIDQDAIDMWREHRIALCGRFDLGGIGASGTRTQGLQRLSESVVPGFQLAKSKKLSMSDWSQKPLTPKQLEYAAADAFAGVAVVSTLMSRPPPHAPSGDETPLPFFGDVDRLRQAILKRERPIIEIEERATRRRAAKKEIKACETVLDLALGQDEAATSLLDASSRRLRRELDKSPDIFKKRLLSARRVFGDTRPDFPMTTNEYQALGMLAHLADP